MDEITPVIKYYAAEGLDLPDSQRHLLKPVRHTDGAVGYDFRAVIAFNDPVLRAESGMKEFPIVIPPGEQVMFSTGIIAAIPHGYYIAIVPRSGIAARAVNLSNSPGTVDWDYRGLIGILLRNYGDKPFIVNRFDRIAQGLINKAVLAEWQGVDSEDDLPPTRRGVGGFGFTGIDGSGPGTEEYDRARKQTDLVFMQSVITAAARSNCIRGCQLDEEGKPVRDTFGHLVGQTRRFGCVFAKAGDVIATGYNAQYKGSDLCEEVGCLRDTLNIPSGERFEQCRAVHAEQMAIINAANRGVELAGSTMYTNCEPCLICANMITDLNINALVVLDGGYSTKEGLQKVIGAGIPFRTVSMNELAYAFMSNIGVFWPNWRPDPEQFKDGPPQLPDALMPTEG